MDVEPKHAAWTSQETPRLAETGGGKRDVIPFVSPEKAAQVFSSQRVMSWEEKKRQIDLSLGRIKDTD